ncbi:hypothetical protein AQUCO_07700004v1 [Aquilegia coerulea]|uniref:Strawberry notch AAA domain-containing protein n=1 Tax=Aquilegia coerulea TaxID=218851 RepID=A0A2G5C811_AQUCA|nr:hypothetical protein AQUCO_07700004v1 [Aquilegia coerulea]
MDMKARGMHVCRTLSYQGAEFEVIETPLEAEMLKRRVHLTLELPWSESSNTVWQNSSVKSSFSTRV